MLKWIVAQKITNKTYENGRPEISIRNITPPSQNFLNESSQLISLLTIFMAEKDGLRGGFFY
jgi:hypothetical protein